MLLGDVGAGKSSLVLRFVKGQFVEFQVGAISDMAEGGCWWQGGWVTILLMKII